jgi:hypothetical protein
MRTVERIEQPSMRALITGLLLMTQAERDRLVALKKAKKKLITQKHPWERSSEILTQTLMNGWRYQQSGRANLPRLIWKVYQNDLPVLKVAVVAALERMKNDVLLSWFRLRLAYALDETLATFFCIAIRLYQNVEDKEGPRQPDIGSAHDGPRRRVAHFREGLVKFFVIGFTPDLFR